MDQMTRYKYHPIQPDQVRLCRFTQDGDRLDAVLETFPAEGPHPPYIALSYTWDLSTCNAGRSWVLQIGQRHLSVLASLRPFVESLQSEPTSFNETWWWIDSICIDQTNFQERGEHVRRMRRTYQNAHKTVVWLGEQSDDSDVALAFITLLNKINDEEYTNDELRTILNHDQYCSGWVAFRDFFSRKWWTRVWTVQEFAIPSDISFWCGQRRFSREAVFAALAIADRCNAPCFKDTIAFHHAFNRRRIWKFYEAVQKSDRDVTLSLLALATYLCNNEATDDRDRLYGLSGLSTENHGLDIDYSLSTDNVYLRFAQSFITQHQSLDILSFSSLFTATPGSSLPSWVPDWRTRLQPLVVPLMASQSSSQVISNLRPPRLLDLSDSPSRYSACSSKLASFSFEDLALLVRGCVVDVVDGIAGSQEAELNQRSEHHSQYLSEMCSPADILTSICRCLALNRGDRYLTVSMPTEAFHRDFVHLCLRILSGQRHLVHSTFKAWFESVRFFRIQGSTLEDILRAIHHEESDSFTFWSPNQDEYLQDSFFGRFYDTVVRMSLRLMMSRNCRLGMIPQNAINGDLVCVLFGCSIPILLRESKRGNEFTVVGECFLDGCMEGEALEGCENREEIFRIV